ncbi:MAG: hypothetical protein IPM29_10470 [Planctomycetes bacterium]|nr:hypothetical protein [Planctomycetota bacterium]
MVNRTARFAAQRGSTLVECAVATALLTALAVGVGSRSQHRDLAVRHAFETTVAERELSNVAERERLQAATALSAGTVDLPAPGAERHLACAHLTRASRQLEPGLWELELELSWQPSGGTGTRSAARVVRLATELTR